MMKNQYKISEIFYSIQGEGGYVGTPMVFVRFSGCNLHCPWCDTDHKKGKMLTVKEIIKKIQGLVPHPFPNLPICLTGGEPTLQVDLELELQMIGAGFSLHLETNGRLGPYGRYGHYKCVTISPKEPYVYTDKEEEKSHHGINFPEEKELKIVYDTANLKLKEIMKAWSEAPLFNRKYIQPLMLKDGSTNTKEVIEFVKKNPGWRISTQLQKILGFQ